MGEYIDRLDASTIPVLPVEQRVPFGTVGEAFEEGWREALEMVAMMEPADVVERPRWISVKERMPEDGKNVLAYEGGGFYFLDWCCDGEWVVASASTAVVTHWMPLPEPPKEEAT